jgi:hypothetical protein
MTYSKKLIEIKKTYPFDKWRKSVYPKGGFEGQFSSEDYECGRILLESCNHIQYIVDKLIDKLIEVGNQADQTVKEKIIAITVITTIVR